MLEEHRIPMTRVRELFRKFGSTLMEILPFKDVHCLIFFYLFAGKVYAGNPWHCAYSIFRALKEQYAPFPLYRREKAISARDISEALDRLTALGFVCRESVKSENVRRFRERFKRAGRPPTCVYGVKSIPEIMERIMNEIEDKKRRLLEVLGPLSDIEEAAERTM